MIAKVSSTVKSARRWLSCRGERKEQVKQVSIEEKAKRVFILELCLMECSVVRGAEGCTLEVGAGGRGSAVNVRKKARISISITTSYLYLLNHLQPSSFYRKVRTEETVEAWRKRGDVLLQKLVRSEAEMTKWDYEEEMDDFEVEFELWLMLEPFDMGEEEEE
ncbi:hypothetical protein M422DRAFT_258324 [Sphaerobolus stellatus SS14]|uniref:Uncharacterized protein n=1 Tax=Sphaerobolus stellatus (strain SS14) TaxID=990650 RepID=A0A0C9VMN6_SPHS4|nr:hypothetical protein M422DRAFT_258324 [Sphaerobolus stellatus SS14]